MCAYFEACVGEQQYRVQTRKCEVTISRKSTRGVWKCESLLPVADDEHGYDDCKKVEKRNGQARRAKEK